MWFFSGGGGYCFAKKEMSNVIQNTFLQLKKIRNVILLHTLNTNLAMLKRMVSQTFVEN